MKLKIFFANFQILGPLGCQGWVVIPQNVKKVKITAHYSGPLQRLCAAGFALLNLPKGKSLGRSKPVTSSYAQALSNHCVGLILVPISSEMPYAK
jgi:hypothetical protein